jgi:hypothetical protein
VNKRIRPVQAASAATTLQATVRRTDLISRSETGGLSVQAVDRSLLETLGSLIYRLVGSMMAPTSTGVTGERLSGR